MLSVILTVLKAIGLILLILLGVVILALLLVLFMPIVYRVKAENQDTEHLLEGLKAHAKVRWLFGLLRGGYAYPEPERLIVKVLFFTVYDSGKEQKKAVSKAGDEDEEAGNEGEETGKAAKDKAEPVTGDAEIKTALKKEENAGEKHKDSEKPDVDDKDTVKEGSDIPDGESQNDEYREIKTGNDEPRKSEKREAETPGKGLRAKFDKFKYTIYDTCDKIKSVWENFSYYKGVFEQEDTKQLLKHVFKRLGKVLKSIRPRKLKADIRFGTGSPDTTGYAYGVYGMLCSVLGKNVFVTPDFEQAVLAGNLYAAGHITLFTILWHAFMIVIDKKVWEFMSKIKRDDA